MVCQKAFCQIVFYLSNVAHPVLPQHYGAAFCQNVRMSHSHARYHDAQNQRQYFHVSGHVMAVLAHAVSRRVSYHQNRYPHLGVNDARLYPQSDHHDMALRGCLTLNDCAHHVWGDWIYDLHYQLFCPDMSRQTHLQGHIWRILAVVQS